MYIPKAVFKDTSYAWSENGVKFELDAQKWPLVSYVNDS